MPEKVAPPRWLKPMNAVLLVARRLGLGWTRELPVLVLPGRKTGKLRQTPVSVLDLDGQDEHGHLARPAQAESPGDEQHGVHRLEPAGRRDLLGHRDPFVRRSGRGWGRRSASRSRRRELGLAAHDPEQAADTMPA